MTWPDLNSVNLKKFDRDLFSGLFAPESDAGRPAPIIGGGFYPGRLLPYIREARPLTDTREEP